jgi:ABC-type transporter Mla subunit MlaD
MTPMPQRPRNLALAGGMVLLAGSGLFAAALTLPRIQWTRPVEHRLEFPLWEGIDTLAVGSPVEAAGLVKGEVTSIALGRSSRELQADDVAVVTISVPPALRIPKTATARLAKPLIGTTTSIELLGIGGPGPFIDAGATIALSPPRGFLELALGRDRSELLQQAIGRFGAVDELSARIRSQASGEFAAIRDALASLDPSPQSRIEAWGEAWTQVAETPSAMRAAFARVRDEAELLQEDLKRAGDALREADSPIATFGPAAGGNLRQLKMLAGLDGDEAEWVVRIEPIVASFERLDRGLGSMLGRFEGFAADAAEQWRLSAAQFALVGGLFKEITEELVPDILRIAVIWASVQVGALPTPDMEAALRRDESVRSVLRAMESLRAAGEAVAALAESPAAAASGVIVTPEVRAAVEAAESQARDAATRLFERIMAPPR